MLWISKWVDYSDKYGLGYQLCDDSVGVLFNDSTRLIMTAGGAENLQYIDREGYEHLCTMKDYSDQLKKKVTLLKVKLIFFENFVYFFLFLVFYFLYGRTFAEGYLNLLNIR